MVVKNSVILRAAEGQALEQLKEHFIGPVAVAFSHEDPVAIAQVLTEELIAKLLFLMQSPVSRFVKVLAAAGPRRLATALDQISKQKS